MSLEPPYVKVHEEMRRQLRRMYEKNGMDEPMYPGGGAYGVGGQIEVVHYQGTPLTPHGDRCFCGGEACAQRARKAIPAPPGVHVLKVQRIGDEQREVVRFRLQELCVGGYIDQDEFDARLDAVNTANTKDELDFLVRDLPGFPEKIVIASSKDRQHPLRGFVMAPWSPLLIGVAAGLVITGIAMLQVLGLTVLWISYLVYATVIRMRS